MLGFCMYMCYIFLQNDIKGDTAEPQYVEIAEFQAFVSEMSLMSQKVQHLEEENKILKKSIESVMIKTPGKHSNETMQCKYKMISEAIKLKYDLVI